MELKHGSHNEVVSLPYTTNKSSARFQAEDVAAHGVDHNQDFQRRPCTTSPAALNDVGRPPAPAAATSCDVPGEGRSLGRAVRLTSGDEPPNMNYKLWAGGILRSPTSGSDCCAGMLPPGRREETGERLQRSAPRVGFRWRLRAAALWDTVRLIRLPFQPVQTQGLTLTTEILNLVLVAAHKHQMSHSFCVKSLFGCKNCFPKLKKKISVDVYRRSASLQ